MNKIVDLTSKRIVVDKAEADINFALRSSHLNFRLYYGKSEFKRSIEDFSTNISFLQYGSVLGVFGFIDYTKNASAYKLSTGYLSASPNKAASTSARAGVSGASLNLAMRW
jgi:hypothetical protein